MNKQRNTPKSFSQWMFVALVVLAISLTGCQSEKETSEDGRWTAEQGNEADSPQKSYYNNDNKISEPSVQTPDQETSTETSGVQKGDQQKKDNPNVKAWNVHHPQLYSVSIGESSDTVMERFGQESDRYSLEEKAGTIQVLEYDGFAIGINQDDKVQFVEVYKADIPTGLSGLRIGDKPEKAVDELGKPSSQSEYLIIYDGEGATLRLDVNPDMNEIVSMKLLPLS